MSNSVETTMSSSLFHFYSLQQPGAVVVVQQPSGTQSTVVYTAPQYTGEGYPVQYPMAQPGQYPAQNAAAPMGHYPPPQYSATAPGGVQLGAEAIPPKAQWDI